MIKLLIYIIITALELLAFWSIIWLLFSILASYVKSTNKDCQKVYTIEKVIQADWFCQAKSR